eukprot:9198527-Pyramimonas_sp.AAC.1
MRGVTGRFRPLGPWPLLRPASVEQRRPRWSRGSGYPTARWAKRTANNLCLIVPCVHFSTLANTMMNPSNASSLALRSSRSRPSSRGDSPWAALKPCHCRQPVS